MLRLTFLISGILASVNFYFTGSIIVQILSIICLLVGLGVAIFWPEPLPPPPSLDLWSKAPEIKERDMKLCSNCGKAVDQKWSMCPYCSKRV
jgi:hypothetical protein|tara:strand:- start:174 stop:449 length:276 start_codon:yes stop_codon:yes gene_type:complete